jgi:hypothetical protein
MERMDPLNAVIALRYLLPFKSFLSFEKELVKCINYYLKKADCINHSVIQIHGIPGKLRKYYTI